MLVFLILSFLGSLSFLRRRQRLAPVRERARTERERERQRQVFSFDLSDSGCVYMHRLPLASLCVLAVVLQ